MRQSLSAPAVVLVSMPFGPLRQPSLGLSLLKAAIPEHDCAILYLGLRFAEEIGADLYTEISDGALSGTSMLGEWLFRPALFEEETDPVDHYLDEILAGELGGPLSSERRRSVLGARDRVASFVARGCDEILAHEPRIVGLTSVFQQNVASLALARALKRRRPELPVLIGGANCEGVMGLEMARQFPFLDGVVSGEAEVIFPRIVGRLLAGRPLDDLRGVTTHPGAASLEGDLVANAPRIDSLDRLPYPDFDDFFDQWRASPASDGLRARLLFETSRGCWWGAKQHCTFCGLNGSTMAFRSKSSSRALEELDWLTARYPGHGVMVVDNILDMGYFKEFLPALARRERKTKLFYEVKANLKKEQVRTLRDAGVLEIQPGIENFSDDVLAKMAKGVTALQNIQLLKWCAEYGVWPTWHFIWGFPGERPEEYRRMAELIPLLSHLPPPRVFMPIRLDRFSPNFERSEEMGFVAVEPYPAYGQIYPLAKDAVHNLAYFFTSRHRNGRRPREYTTKLAERLTEWQDAYPQSELFSLRCGDQLRVWDLRPAARHGLWVLDGIQRGLLESCDRARTLEWLAESLAGDLERAAAIAQVEEAAAPLLEGGLLLRDGDRLLALAIARTEPRAAPGPADRLRRQAPPSH